MISKFCNWIARVPHDKLLHFVVVYLITDILLLTTSDPLLSTMISYATISLFILAKEHIDEYKYNGFDWMDILAGCAGYVIKIVIYFISVL